NRWSGWFSTRAASGWGGGLLVVDITATPMAIVAEYDKSTVKPVGCVGVEVHGKAYISAGGGAASQPYGLELYAFPMTGFSTTPNPPNEPLPNHIVTYSGEGPADGHGVIPSRHGRYL